MEGSTLKGSPASMKNGPLEISEDALKTAKERIFRLKVSKDEISSTIYAYLCCECHLLF